MGEIRRWSVGGRSHQCRWFAPRYVSLGSSSWWSCWSNCLWSIVYSLCIFVFFETITCSSSRVIFLLWMEGPRGRMKKINKCFLTFSWDFFNSSFSSFLWQSRKYRCRTIRTWRPLDILNGRKKRTTTTTTTIWRFSLSLTRRQEGQIKKSSSTVNYDRTETHT